MQMTLKTLIKRRKNMKRNMKRMISTLLALMICLSLCPRIPVPAQAETVGLTLEQLREKFPHGKYWNHADNPGASNAVNNQDGYSSVPCSRHGTIGTDRQTCNGFQPGNRQLSWQCMGYAEKLGYDATGLNPRDSGSGWYIDRSLSALDELKPGDIVRYRYDGHSIYVTDVQGDIVTYTDCNGDGHCVIHWDMTVTKAQLRASFTYVHRAPSATEPGPAHCDCSEAYAGEYICATESTPLNIRSGHGSTYPVIGAIPKGATVLVSKASGTGNDDWAHVTYNGLSGYASMQYLSKKQAEPDVRWSHATTTLGGIIGLNFYVELSDDLAANETTAMRFVFDGKTLEVPLSAADAVSGDDGVQYRFTCPLNAKNMTDPVSAQIVTSNGAVGDAKTLAIVTYCEYMIQHGGDEELSALMKAMLNYGAAAQILFGHNTDALANASLSEADRQLPAVDASAYAYGYSGSEEGVQITNATLLLETETAARIYFTLAENKTVDQLVCTLDGVTVQPQVSGSGYFLEIPDIAAQDLDAMHTLTIGGITVTYSGLSYVNQVLRYENAGETLVNTVKALFIYNKMAERFFQ